MYVSSRLHRGKLIYDAHEVHWQRSGIERFLEKTFIYKAAAVITVSPGRAEAMAKHYSINNITVIANYPIISNDFVAINRLVINRLIFSGGLDLNFVRLDNLLLVLVELEQFSLDILGFGYGDSYEKLKKIISNLNLKDRVKFIPMVSPNRVIETISRYDVGVNLLVNHSNKISLKYPSSNKMYEYLAAGLPILCSDLDGYKEFEEEGVAVSVTPSNVESIKIGLMKLFCNQENLLEMKKRCIFLSRAKYNWENQEEKYLNIFKKLER